MTLPSIRTASALLALASVLLLGSCVTTGGGGGASNLRAAKQSLANIENGMNAYHNQYGRWPASIAVLQSFAAQRGRTIDLSAFSKFTITPANSETVVVEFTTLPPESKSEVFATTRKAVR